MSGRIAVTTWTKPPPYAILSHTWDYPEQEVTLQDLQSGKSNTELLAQKKAGYIKLQFCLDQAAINGWTYVWTDTTCIDRTNDAELGHSVYSMFKYYQDAAICYVYLGDVSIASKPTFIKSRWHTRAWALQELVVPVRVQFYDGEGKHLGSREELSAQIIEASGVNVAVPWQDTPLTERFRWSFNRVAILPEDQSYCLLALLEVKMTLVPGEGVDRARERLLEAVGAKHGNTVVQQMRQALREYEESSGMILAKRDESLTSLAASNQIIRPFEDEARRRSRLRLVDVFSHAILQVRAERARQRRLSASPVPILSQDIRSTADIPLEDKERSIRSEAIQRLPASEVDDDENTPSDTTSHSPDTDLATPVQSNTERHDELYFLISSLSKILEAARPTPAVRYMLDALRDGRLKVLVLLGTQELSLADTLKNAIEGFHGEEWDWRPFQAPKKPLPPGHARLWCTYEASGIELYCDLPLDLGHKVAYIFDRLPSQFRPRGRNQPASSALLPTFAQDIRPASQRTIRRTSRGPPEEQTRPRPDDDGESTDIETDLQTKAYIYVVVRRGDCFKYKAIKVTACDDLTFYLTLRSVYYELRGITRTWLSWRGFDGCEMFQLKQACAGECYPLQQCMPPQNDADYKPGIGAEVPPKDEFRDMFEHVCQTPSCLHWHRCGKIFWPDQNALERMPKRQAELDAANRRRSMFYGLRCYERMRFRFVLNYGIIAILPSTGYAINCLIRGHPEQISQAMVPFMATMSLLGLLLTLLLADRRDEEKHR